MKEVKATNTGLLFKKQTLLRALIFCGLLYALWNYSLPQPERSSAFISGLLTILSISAGFLASFYFFIISRVTMFLGEIQNTETFSSLISLMKLTLLLNVFSVALSFIVSVIGFSEFLGVMASQFFYIFWLGCVSLSIANIWRCAQIFSSIAN